ncbi:MAG: prephenate dehydrogenase [Negativicutes bacterium]|jgi:prephenate dehydrogenase
MRTDNIIIIGMGLIGGSLALALKNSGFKGIIRGYDRDSKNVDMALAKGAVDIVTSSLDEVLADEGIVFVATPLGAYKEIFGAVGRLTAGRQFLVSDVGSVKGYAEKLAAEFMPEVTFIGGHPMAGSEKNGFWAATPYLFENAYYFLTPTGKVNSSHVEKLKQIIAAIGAIPLTISADEHDKIVARISHLPHLAAALVANALATSDSINFAAFAGGGFRDTTRIAASNPDLWRDILLLNKQEVLPELAQLEHYIGELREIIAAENGVALRAFLAKAKFVREGLPKHSRDYLPSLFNIFVSVKDQPGIIAKLTQIIGENKLNICEIEILHVRENIDGAIRIAFASESEQCSAKELLNDQGFNVSSDGDEQHVDS